MPSCAQATGNLPTETSVNRAVNFFCGRCDILCTFLKTSACRLVINLLMSRQYLKWCYFKLGSPGRLINLSKMMLKTCGSVLFVH